MKLKILPRLFFLLLLSMPSVSLFALDQPLDRAPEIAERVVAATVGIYSTITEYDKYYGSGVLISADGYILTSTTAAPRDAGEIEIYLADHRRFAARVIAAAENSETALLKIDGENLPFLPLREELPTLGESCFACGNANNMIRLGDGASFSRGVISGIYPLENADAQSAYHGTVIETDAAINPGQDGGALIDSSGRVVGIISRGFSLTRWQGVAIPLSIIFAEMPALKNLSPVFDPPFAIAPNVWADIAAKYRPAMVALEIIRAYPPEILPRANWQKFVAELATLPPETRRRATADFFAADSLLAANQMVRRPSGTVTGVMISPHGHLLTNVFNVQENDRYFVDSVRQIVSPTAATSVAELLAQSQLLIGVDNPIREIFATLADGRRLPAQIIGFNLPLGLAILKVPTVAKIAYLDPEAAARAPQTGESIALLGAAPPSLNHGIVSANSRYGGQFFQIDSLLNYGNSGGIVLNERGFWLGIAGAPLNPPPTAGKILPFTAEAGKASLSDYHNSPNSGVGLAAASPAIIAALPSLLAGAEIGVDRKITLGIKPANAYAPQVEIAEIALGSLADRTGLRPGDRLLTVDNLQLRSWKEIDDYLQQQPRGGAVALKIFRVGEGEKTLYLKWDDRQTN